MLNAQLILLGAIALKGVAGVAIMDDEWHLKLLKRQAPGTPAYNCHDNCGQAITASRRENHCEDNAFQNNYANCLQCSGPDNYNIWRYYGFTLTGAGEACGLSTTPLSGKQDDVPPAIPAGGVIPSGVDTTTAPPATTTTAEPEPTTEPPTTEPPATTDEPEPTEPEPTVPPTTTAEPTQEPTVEPTEEPTAEPTEEPTAEPTEEPTAEPTEEPTAEPTEEPTAGPTENPTGVPTYGSPSSTTVDGPTPTKGTGNQTSAAPPPPEYTGAANTLATGSFAIFGAAAIAALVAL